MTERVAASREPKSEKVQSHVRIATPRKNGEVNKKDMHEDDGVDFCAKKSYGMDAQVRTPPAGWWVFGLIAKFSST